MTSAKRIAPACLLVGGAVVPDTPNVPEALRWESGLDVVVTGRNLTHNRQNGFGPQTIEPQADSAARRFYRIGGLFPMMRRSVPSKIVRSPESPRCELARPTHFHQRWSHR